MTGYPRVPLPDVALVRRHVSDDHIEDVAGELRRELARVDLARRVKPGQRIAITAGSRGVANIDTLLRTIVEELKRLDAIPFIVPAMGSHGGATAEGQVELIAEYGITEKAMGCPILSSMDNVLLGRTSFGATVHMDKNAHGADGVIVVNRIKAHTAFRAPIESGLCKIMAIGLGKQSGAESIHAGGLGRNIPEAASIMIETGKIVLGVATVENAYHHTCRVVAVPPEKIHDTDREMLVLSNKLLPRIPFEELDVLVMDWIGKNISGSGMDMNVVGMWRRTGEPPFKPMYRRIVVLNVTPESHGNCIGLGVADFTTRKLADQYIADKTYWNTLTANWPEGAKIALTLESELDAVEVALRVARPTGGDYELVRIKSTMDLSEFYVSAPLLEQLKGNPEYEVVRGLGPMPRDEKEICSGGSQVAERAIVIDPEDDVAVAVVDLEAGESCEVRVGEGTVVVPVIERIPFGHKFALRSIPKGENVLKYGEAIGRATADIDQGAWVHTHNLVSARAKERIREEVPS